MEELLDILKYVLPAGIVFATSYYILKTFLENETRKKMLDIKSHGHEVALPVRLQAYERIVLLLERISPTSLVMRVSMPNMSALQLQTALIQNIRDEFEHNLAQQIYISNQAWELTKIAKEDVIKLIHIAASKLNDSATATDLGAQIFELSSQKNKPAIWQALEFVKKEVQQLM